MHTGDKVAFLVECTHVRGSRSLWLLWCLASLAFAFALAPGEVRASEEQEIEAALRAIDELGYEKAAARFEKMLDPDAAACPKSLELTPAGCRITEPVLQRRARGLYTIALHGLKRPNDAKQQFKQLLLNDPTFTPSPAEYPPEVIRLFTEAKKEVEDHITARTVAAQKKQKDYESSVKAYDAWVDETEKVARTETVIVERSRLIASVPFGVGQFQNDSVALGVVFLSLELGFLTTSLVTTGLQNELMQTAICVSGAGTNCGPYSTESAVDTHKTLQIVNITSLALMGATMIAGIIEAQVSFEGESPRTRARPLGPRPPKPIPPKVGVTGVPNAPSDTVGVGVTVRF